MKFSVSLGESPTEDEFYRILLQEDELGRVLRTHLIIEHELNKLIALSVVDPLPLDRINMDYEDKVHLAVAIGLNSEWAPSLLNIGKIRNKFAHNLKTNLDDNIVKALYSTLPSLGKEAVQGAYKKNKEQSERWRNIAFGDLKPADKFVLLAVNFRGMLIAAQKQTKK